MARNLTLLIIILFSCFQIFAQVVITSNDMPVPGDTIRKSITAILDTNMDYHHGGPDQNWLFDELTVVSQQVDTFVNVSQTPSVYQFFFNNQFIYPDYKATVAMKMAEFTAIPTVTLTDSYQFLKVTSNEYREVGYGVTLDGVPLPIQLTDIDTLYRFPLEYGNVDSAHSLLSINVPNLGYLMVSKFRRNTADGWGTLTTPYGEFQTLRVRTEIVEYDSIYSDSLGVGIPLTRNITEYKWFANGYHEPVLLVSEEAFLVTATYIDSVRSTFLGVPEVVKKSSNFDFSVYPNPCSIYLTINYELKEDADVRISVYSIYGNEIKQFASTRQDRGYYNQVLYLKESGLHSGVYLVRITIDNVPYMKRIVVG
jgi:hypothetical protein